MMGKDRLEMFSDGVIAIIITIMALELKVPHDPTWRSYADASPVFLSYAISFLFVGLFWATHHHLFKDVEQVNNRTLWLNLLNLFFLSLVPFATAAMGETAFSSVTVTVYALVLIPVTTVYVFLVNSLCSLHGSDSRFAKTYKGHLKSYLTIGLNALAAIIAFLGLPKIAFALIVATALTWFIPNHVFGVDAEESTSDNTKAG